MRVFISGGCKNGKSMFAQRVSVKLGEPLYYVATMIPYDEEDYARIRRHLKEREGWGFETIECGTDILRALDGLTKDESGKVKGTFLLDSVTALLLNEMFGTNYNVSGDESAGERCAEALVAFANSVQNAVFVSDYLYSDASIYDDITENYRKALALVDKSLARCCDTVIEVCVGNRIYHKGCAKEWE